MRLEAEQLRTMPLNLQEQVAIALVQQKMETEPVAGRKAYEREYYGFTEDEVTAFRMRWNRYIKKDTVWPNFEEFLKWVSCAGYTKGARIVRHDGSQPYGPENAYIRKGRILSAKEVMEFNKPVICRGCPDESASCSLSGCPQYKEWFIKNWDENIHQDIPPHLAKPKKTVFQYEHPDRVREIRQGRSKTS